LEDLYFSIVVGARQAPGEAFHADV